MIVHTCRVCGDELNDDNWYASYMRNNNCICKECHNEKVHLWRKDNPEKSKVISTRNNTRNRRKNGQFSMSENKKCSSYLGVHIAERVLRHAFKNVEMMSYGNPGYDFVCNQGMLIDGKSSCFNKGGRWLFSIDRNVIADYFLCLAFDNREDLTTLYAWMLPGEKFNHLMSATIRPGTIHKWDEYKLDITKISTCCDAMKDGKL